MTSPFNSCAEAAEFFKAHRKPGDDVWGHGDKWFYNLWDESDAAWEGADGPFSTEGEARDAAFDEASYANDVHDNAWEVYEYDDLLESEGAEK